MTHSAADSLVRYSAWILWRSRMSDVAPPGGERRKELLVVPAGLLGFSAVAVLQIAVLPSIDWPHWFSLLSFTIAIPLLAGQLIRWYDHYFTGKEIETRFSAMGAWIGWGAVVFGIGALVWHISWVIACSFALAILVAIRLYEGSIDRGSSRRLGRPPASNATNSPSTSVPAAGSRRHTGAI
jgi:hypothetical protein